MVFKKIRCLSKEAFPLICKNVHFCYIVNEKICQSGFPTFIASIWYLFLVPQWYIYLSSHCTYWSKQFYSLTCWTFLDEEIKITRDSWGICFASTYTYTELARPSMFSANESLATNLGVCQIRKTYILAVITLVQPQEPWTKYHHGCIASLWRNQVVEILLIHRK